MLVCTLKIGPYKNPRQSCVNISISLPGGPVLHPPVHLAGHGGRHDGVPSHWLHWPCGGERGGEAKVITCVC